MEDIYTPQQMILSFIVLVIILVMIYLLQFQREKAKAKKLARIQFMKEKELKRLKEKDN